MCHTPPPPPANGQFQTTERAVCAHRKGTALSAQGNCPFGAGKLPVRRRETARSRLGEVGASLLCSLPSLLLTPRGDSAVIPGQQHIRHL